MTETTFLYRCYDEQDVLLYVGIAGNPMNRLCQHEKGSQWFDKLKNINVEPYPSRRLALEAEKEAIKEEKPLYNRRYMKSAFRPKKILIGAHFDPSAKRILALLRADPRNEGKQSNDLLAEALNDLCAKYNVPQIVKLARDS